MKTPKISVIVTAYNHEEYIAQCLDSILMQEGPFELEIILGDDCSTDKTRQIMQEYTEKHPDIFVLLAPTANMGLSKNIKRCLDACSGDYIAFCEGDDYWTDGYKLRKQVEFLQEYQDYAMCFNAIICYYEELNIYEPNFDQLIFQRDYVTIHDLLKSNNIIVNFSCCMYRTSIVRKFSDELYDVPIADWMFNMACSRFGKLGFVRDWMSVWRIHSKGAWSGKSHRDQDQEVCQMIDAYNKFFDYEYNKQFSRLKHKISTQYKHRSEKPSIPYYNTLHPAVPMKEPFVRKYGGLLIRAIRHPDQAYNRLSSSVSIAFAELTTGAVSAAVQRKDAQIAVASSQIAELSCTVQTKDGRIAVPTKEPFVRKYGGLLIRAMKHPGQAYNRLSSSVSIAFAELTTGAVSAAVQSRDAQIAVLSPQIAELSSTVQTKDGRIAVPNSLAQVKEVDLLILDTFFPHPISRFRLEEFCVYLKHFRNSMVLSTGEHLPAVKETRNLGAIIHEFENLYPDFIGRTQATTHDIDGYSARLAYLVFLSNAGYFLDALEKKGIPFIFTLYPGGGFEINQGRSDSMLRRILGSVQFRKVIVTQRITYDYLVKNNFCSEDKIVFIYGGVMALDILNKSKGYERKSFGFEKDSLDICFVAVKYMPMGVDKGYDVFIEVAKKLAQLHSNINFHVVGNFTEADIPANGLEGRLTFYGFQELDWFDNFYLDKDIILSPNIPFVLLKGTFDGFPTAACMEAMLRKVAVFCTDELKLNDYFIDNEEIVVIPHDAGKITRIIEAFYEEPAKLRRIGEKGAMKACDVFSYARQMLPRIEILRNGIKNATDED